MLKVRTEKSSKRFPPVPRLLVPAEVVESVVRAAEAVAAETEPREAETEVAVVAIEAAVVVVVTAKEAAVVVAMAREVAADVADPELPLKMVSRVNKASVARDSPVSASPAKTERREAKAVVVDVVAAPKEVKVRTEDPDVRIASRTTTSQEKRERPFAESQSPLRRKSKRSATLLMTTLQTSLPNPQVLPLVASRR
ncbi:MAG: hypothetical protein GY841_08320 [FCB group bacterium]|nr:hypothetical protein [FCB group bacterium]